jgi:hypothetical protein
MTRMQTHIATHYGRLLAAAGVAVTYQRTTSSVAISQAAPATTLVRVEDAEGLSLRSRRRDWIIRAADLVLNDEAVTPAVGDRIVNGRLTYEVQRLAGEDCFYPCDAEGAFLRIHTRLVMETAS